MAFGETLKNARTQKGLSPSEVAEATHMMVQIVEDLEREDFRRIAAPIYGRGFVKLYAELLELDADPLIRDFMDLYSGARAPSVRMRAVEGAPKPPAEPVTRTPSAVPPQRQAVQARPSVRPLSLPHPDAGRADEAAGIKVDEVAAEPPPKLPKGEGDLPAPDFGVDPAPMVVEPEGAAYAETDEPDLFRPQPARRKRAEAPVAARGSDLDAEVESVRPKSERKPKMPVFKIGGRLEEERAPEVGDEAAHARRLAKIQKFAEGFNKLRRGVERRLTSTLPYKRYVAIGSAGLVVLVCMGFGLHTLFKLTGGTNVKEAPAALVEKVAPPPDLYVD